MNGTDATRTSTTHKFEQITVYVLKEREVIEILISHHVFKALGYFFFVFALIRYVTCLSARGEQKLTEDRIFTQEEGPRLPSLVGVAKAVLFLVLETLLFVSAFLTNPVIQFGYVTLFVAAFPLAPFFAFWNNILEIRSAILTMY